MGKPVDKGNTTMPLSESQVVSVTPMVAKNDQSVWKGLVVSGDDFAPPKPKSRRWMIFGGLGAGVVAVGIYAFARTASDQPKPAAAVSAPADAAVVQPSAVIAPVADAAIAVAPVDAADALLDAASVEAVQPPAPAKKPVPKKKPTRKKRGH